MTDLSKRISGLSSERLKLLAQRLKEKNANNSTPEIRRQSRDTNIYPLSFEQERLWFIDQLEPGDPAYNIAIAFRYSVPDYVHIAERSLNEIIRRHDILRASFPVIDGQPVQLIAPSLILRPDLIDLRGLSSADQEVKAKRLAREEAKRPFNLAVGPLIRVKILMLKEVDFVALITMHHTISDGFSGSILIQEFFYIWDSIGKKKDRRLPELPIQYTDFALWQREHVQREGLAEAIDYWKKQFNGISALDLPIDHPKTSFGSGNGARDSILLSAEFVAALNELSLREGVTLFMTLLAGFKALLYKYCQQEDVVVGSPVFGRNRKELEKLIGLFVNMLVLRTKVEANASFTEMMLKEREVCLGAYAHQEIPFQMLVKELNPIRDLGRQPLFQVGFELNNTPLRFQMQAGEDGVLREGATELGSSRAMFDLRMSIIPLTKSKVVGEGGLECVLEYNRDLFEVETCSRLLRHYKRVLETVVEDPRKRIADIDILGEEERRLLLFEWNDTATELARRQCIHELFEEQVFKSPDRAAVLSEGQSLSCEELNRRANQLAHYLRAKGVGPEEIVGLCLPRSLEMVISMIGILKAGAAYVPLDPAYPRDRLAYMIADSQVRLVITSSRDAGLFAGQAARPLLIDKQWPEVAIQSPINPVPTSTADNLAYVIYTSGSTGRPKGVMVAHRGLLNLVEAEKRVFGIGDQSRILQFSSLTFDASVWEIFSALTTGASLHVHTRERLMPGDDLLTVLREDQITMATLPPTVLAMISEEGLSHLQTVVSAGETCAAEIAERWAAGRRFFNAYGPTEATVCASIGEFESGSDGKPTIGRPIDNTRLYILDREMKPAPAGVKGELYISGIGQARGYLGRVEETAESFVPNPFSEERGKSFYRSGDVCRYLPDGRIEFMGRNDWQIKIRGFRIEMGEIEAVLREHEAIKECVVVLRPMEQEEKHLVCYVIRHGDREIELTELRNYLRDRLPAYMAPSEFVLIDELPLTVNGKIDRARLPKAKESVLKLEEDYAPPRNEVEQIITGIWEEILAGQRIVDRIGVNDNFFDLGGYSLLMIKLQSRLNEVFDRKVTVVEVFQHPTIRGLARYLGEEREKEGAVAKGEDRATIRKNLSRGAKRHSRAN